MSSHNFHAAFINVPSELYRHLHQNYGSFRSESFIRALWLKQMPMEVQVILAAFQDKDIEEVTAVADAVMHVIETNPKKNDIAYRDLLLLQRFDMLSDKVERLASDVRWILKWKAAKEKALGVGELQPHGVVSRTQPPPETWRIRTQMSKSAVKSNNADGWRMRTQKSKSVPKSPPPEPWRIRSQVRVRSASPSSRLKLRNGPRKESLASVNTYNIPL